MAPDLTEYRFHYIPSKGKTILQEVWQCFLEAQKEKPEYKGGIELSEYT